MPIYEYHCDACGTDCEILQKINDAPAKKCPDCGKNKLRKQMSVAGFQLKGTGWYATDFKDKPKEKSTQDKKEEKPKESKPKDTSSDTKNTKEAVTN